MKKIISILIISASMLMTQTAFAEGYFGAGGASIISGPGITFGLTSGVSAGIIVGADVTDNVAVELDVDTSLLKVKVGSAKVNYQTTALFAAFRSGKDTYFKAKIGFHNTVVSVSGSSAATSALAYGVGLGFGDGYEVEYTYLAPETGTDGLSKISVKKIF